MKAIFVIPVILGLLTATGAGASPAEKPKLPQSEAAHLEEGISLVMSEIERIDQTISKLQEQVDEQKMDMEALRHRINELEAQSFAHP